MGTVPAVTLVPAPVLLVASAGPQRTKEGPQKKAGAGLVEPALLETGRTRVFSYAGRTAHFALLEPGLRPNPTNKTTKPALWEPDKL